MLVLPGCPWKTSNSRHLPVMGRNRSTPIAHKRLCGIVLTVASSTWALHARPRSPRGCSKDCFHNSSPGCHHSSIRLQARRWRLDAWSSIGVGSVFDGEGLLSWPGGRRQKARGRPRGAAQVADPSSSQHLKLVLCCGPRSSIPRSGPFQEMVHRPDD